VASSLLHSIISFGRITVGKGNNIILQIQIVFLEVSDIQLFLFFLISAIQELPSSKRDANPLIV